jgi:CubicO group peptidase (beta-lactamase class C family)
MKARSILAGRVAALCAVALLVWNCPVATQGARQAALLASLKARVDGGKSVGMVVGMIEPAGTTAIAAYGSPGPGSLSLDADSVFEIGSITKVFTAILLAEMADRGEVTLDDPIAKYLPANVQVPRRADREITLIDLSTHRSGLPRLPDNLKPADATNPYADYTVAQMYEFLSRHELRRDIGSQFEYSNFGLGLLGHVLALRAGMPYETLLKQRVLDPLGMTHTAITLTPWMQEHLVKGHNTAGAVVPNWDIPTLAGAGGLRSTLNDMLIFARANLEPSGRLQQVMQRTHVVRAPAGNPNAFVGMNWIIRRLDGQDITWHNGGTGGYRTWIGFDRAKRTAAIVLTNSTHGADDLGFELLK